ncbi:MAG TPA: hypothetical protein VFA97_01385 [Gaiellaceae bacterium]|nr:hypothetical protein [Gaiellaceae bacterium]
MFAPGPAIARRDALIAFLFAAFGVPFIGWMQDNGHGGLAPGKPLMGLLILLAVVPVLWRRRAPLLAAAGTLAATAIHVTAYGTITRCGLLLPLLFVEAFAVGAWLNRREAVIGLGIVLGAGVVCLSADASAGWDGLTISVPVTVVLWFVGRWARSRASLAARLHERNIELRVQRETNARLEVESERVRLSAELDGLLRTRLAELAQLAEAGSRDDAGETLAQIEAESRATLEQMRSVVGLLRDVDAATTEPQPTIAHLQALLLSEKGTHAHLSVTGEPRVLPAGLELTAYRVIEHLLNATGDASDVDVQVDFQPDALELRVSGPARSRRQADGAIDRARERLALHHGSLRSETVEGRTLVTAALPVLATA